MGDLKLLLFISMTCFSRTCGFSDSSSITACIPGVKSVAFLEKLLRNDWEDCKTCSEFDRFICFYSEVVFEAIAFIFSVQIAVFSDCLVSVCGPLKLTGLIGEVLFAEMFDARAP